MCGVTGQVVNERCCVQGRKGVSPPRLGGCVCNTHMDTKHQSCPYQ